MSYDAPGHWPVSDLRSLWRDHLRRQLMGEIVICKCSYNIDLHKLGKKRKCPRCQTKVSR